MGDELPLVQLLDARRDALGINWAAVAKAIGAAESTVTRWRQGAVPSSTYVPGIARFLGIESGAVYALLPDAPHPRSRAATTGLEEKVEELSQLLQSFIERDEDAGGSNAADAIRRFEVQLASSMATMQRLLEAIESNVAARQLLGASQAPEPPKAPSKRPRTQPPRTAS